jgi:hypothetical protein
LLIPINIPLPFVILASCKQMEALRISIYFRMGKFQQKSIYKTQHTKHNKVTRHENLHSLHSFFDNTWPLKMGLIGCPETSLRNYRYSLSNNPDEHSVLSSSNSGNRISNGVLQYRMDICNHFEVRWQNCEMHLLASPCLSLRPSVRPHGKNSAPSGRIFMKFDIWIFVKNCLEATSFIKIANE